MINIPNNYFEEIKNIKTEDYFKNNQFAIDVFKQKYTLDEKESICIAYSFKRVCDSIASKEKTEELKNYWSNRWLYEIWNDWWKPAGSIIQGAGNSRKISLSNCTTIDIKNDSIESIFETGYKIAKSAAFRQGLGVDISILRPKKAKIHNSAKESVDGSIGWMKWFDNIGSHVGQRGRIPAMLFSLSIKHPDIIDFIYAKSNLHAIQNANISSQVTDDFMKAYENDEDWQLFYEVNDTKETISNVVKAKWLLKILAEEANRYAEPGLQFIDTCKRESVTDILGFPIKSTNACSEKFMYPDSTCVLASINVGKFKIKNYEKELELISQSITRFLDNVVEYEITENKVPYENQKFVIQNLREIGCGITNLHGWLLKQNLSYDSDEAINKSEKFIKLYSYCCWKNSIELGKEKGNCLAFDKLDDKRDLSKSKFIERLINEFNDLKFDYLRNSQVMSIAPTGTLSLMFSEPIISTGIEPCVGYYYWKRAKTSGRWTWYFVVPQFVRKFLESKNVSLPFDGESIEDNSGEIGEKCQKIIDKQFDPNLFKPAHKIDPFKKIDLMSKFSKWIDSSISVTYNVPENFTSNLVEKLYYDAWKKGIKSISIYRDKSREAIIEFESPRLVSKRFKNENLPKQIETHNAPDRPQLLLCNIHNVKAQNKKYIVIIGFLDNKPYEIFAGAQDEIEIPAKLKFGIVERVGSRKYNLYASEEKINELDLEKNENIFKVKNIIKQFNNDMYADVTRLVSTCLRYGIPSDSIIEQLDKTESDITSFGKAISRVLKNYMSNNGIVDLCQSCKNQSLIRDGACMKCITNNCGYSKCE